MGYTAQRLGKRKARLFIRIRDGNHSKSAIIVSMGVIRVFCYFWEGFFFISKVIFKFFLDLRKKKTSLNNNEIMEINTV